MATNFDPGAASPEALPIASLDPSHPTLPQDCTLIAEVALLWPYSSSTRRAALLITEPDFRLRRHKGQVRVQLHGAAASAVGSSRIAIGDHVQLSLSGATWAGERSAVTAPGRAVDGELLFDRELHLKIERDGVVLKSIDVHEPRPVSPAHKPTSPPSSSNRLPSSQLTAASLTSPAAWASPAFLRRKEERFRPAIRPAFTAPADPLPFSTDEIVQEELDNQKPRKRTKFGRKSGEWKFTQEDDAPDYTQHDLTGTFDVEMIEREIDAEEGRKTGSPARGGREERRTKKQDRYDVPDFGLDGSSASRPRPFVEVEEFERIIKETRPAILDRTVVEHVADEHQATQDTFSTAPEYVKTDRVEPDVNDVQSEGSMLSDGSIDVPDEAKDRGDKPSVASNPEPAKPVGIGENDVQDVQDDGHVEEHEHDMNDQDVDEDGHEDEDNDEDENQDDTDDDTKKDEEQVQREQEPEEQQSQTIADEEQEDTTAQPLISTITATEEVSQASAQLHAELASQLEEPGFVHEDPIRTDDTIEAFTAPQDHEESSDAAGKATYAEVDAEKPSVIPVNPQIVDMEPGPMNQDATIDRSTDSLNVPHEFGNFAKVSSGPDTSSIEQPGTNEATSKNTTPIEEGSEAELPVVMNPQLDSVTGAEPDVDLVSQHAADINAHDEAEKLTNLKDSASPIVVNEDGEIDAHDAVEDAFSLEDNALPIVVSGDESSSIEELEAERQPLSDTLMQEQHDDSKSTEHLVESAVEPVAQEEAVKAVLAVPDTDPTSQPSPEIEAQGSLEDASLVIDSTGLSMNESGHQEKTSEIEGPNEPQENLASAPGLQHQKEASGVGEDVIQTQSTLDATEESASTIELPKEDVTVDTTNDIAIKIARLEAMTDEQLLQEGQSMLAELIEENQQETQMPGELSAIPRPTAVDTSPALSGEQTPQEPLAQRLSAFEVMQSRLNRPSKVTDVITALTPDVVEQSERSSSEEEMQEDEKEPSLVISVLDDSSDAEDDQVDYDDIPGSAENASTFGSKNSEESFTGFDDEEQLGPDAATVDQDSVLGFEIDERPDPDLASSEEEPFAEFEDEEEVDNRSIRDLGRLEEMEVENEGEYDVQTVDEDMEDAKVKAPQTSVTADESIDPRLQSAEHKDYEVDEDMDEEGMKNQEEENGMYEDEVLPELDFKLIPDLDKPLVSALRAVNDAVLASSARDGNLPTLEDQDEELESRNADIGTGIHDNRGVHALDPTRHSETSEDDEEEDEDDEVDEQVSKGIAAEDLKNQGNDRDLYEEDDEDDVLPELDFSQIPSLEKPLVAGLSAINDPGLAPFEEDNHLSTLPDQDEQIHSQTAGTNTGAHHDRGVHSRDHMNHESVNGNSTHHETMPLEQADIELEISKPEPRKRSSSRKSNVPSELKGWFSPRESLQDGYKNDITSIEKEVEVSHVKGVYSGGRRPSLPSSFNANGQKHGHKSHEQQLAEPSSSAPVAGSRQTKHSGLVPQRLSDEAHKLVGGLHTSLSYYTPLTDLQVHTNSQHEHDSVVDVLAIVSSFTAKAKRATSGPKDHFTTFHITSPTPRTDFSPVEVQVFRPRKEVLPLADVGDVALLRNFVVRSNNGKSFLLSTAGSAWCVWRYAKKERLDLKNVGEECMGPPVEIGIEECQRALELSNWWKNEKVNEAGADARPVFRWSWRASD